MDLNEGKFRDNGGCGYLLKPSIMRQGKFQFFLQIAYLARMVIELKLLTVNACVYVGG